MRVNARACVGSLNAYACECAFFSADVQQCPGKNKKIANNSLTNKDKVRLFPVHKLHTQSVLLVPKSSFHNLGY